MQANAPATQAGSPAMQANAPATQAGSPAMQANAFATQAGSPAMQAGKPRVHSVAGQSRCLCSFGFLPLQHQVLKPRWLCCASAAPNP